MKIKLPTPEDQKKIVEKEKIDLESKKIRTSFEFSEKVNQYLENEAAKQGIPPSELFRRIIEDSNIDMGPFKRRLKNLTVYQSHMEKLQVLADDTVPDSWKGKRGGNRSYVAEILIMEYMKQKGAS